MILKVIMGLFFLYGLSVQAQMVQSSSCLLLEGIIIDYATHKSLKGAQILVRQSTSLKPITTTNNFGKFSAKIPCESMAVFIEKKGYRSQIISLRGLNVQMGLHQIVFQVPLIAVERQQNDHTYLQSEQKEYIQPGTAKSQLNLNSNLVQHGQFAIIDALRNKPLKANVCFIYTKNAEKKCFDTDQNGKLDIDFKERDIVAIEVSAEGYQRYEGNLLVETLDGRNKKHSIALQRELIILAVQASKGSQCELVTQTKTYKLSQVLGNVGWYSTYEVLPGTYDLIVKQKGNVSKQSINLQSGLNYTAVATAIIATETPKSAPLPVEITNANISVIQPDSLPMIYFEQSSYILRTDSQESLKQVALYLKSHKDYKVQVAGHTDNVGKEYLNKDLSEFRAAVVVNFLVRHGVEESRCLKVGYGSQYPISANDTEAHKAINRRVSLKLIVAK